MPRFGVIRALVRRDFLITRSYRVAFVLQLAAGIVGLVVYLYISRTFGGVSARVGTQAPSYFAFAAVGIAIAGVVQAASVGLAQRVREEQLTGTLEALATQPVTATELAIGLAGFPFVFATLSAVVYLGVANALGADFSRADWLGFSLAITATGAALAGLGMLIGALVFVVKRAESLAGLAIGALALVGGAYFPIKVLPGWAQSIAEFVPTRFAFDSVRAALYRGHGWQHPTLMLVVIAAVLGPVSIVLFDRAVVIAKRRGSLGQY